MIQLKPTTTYQRYTLEGCSHTKGDDVREIQLDDLDRLGDSLASRFRNDPAPATLSNPLPGVATMDVYRGEQASSGFADDTYRSWGQTDDGREIHLDRSVTLEDRSFLPRTLGKGLFYLGYGVATAGMMLGSLGGGLQNTGGSMMRCSSHLMHRENGARYQLFVTNPGGEATDQMVARQGGNIVCEHHRN